MASFKYYLYITLLLFSFTVSGQHSTTDQKIEHYMKEAGAFMDAGNYEEANMSFRKLLALQTVVPTEMCYYFAETLFQLHQYQNSKNFINKYLKLTGTSGPFYRQVLELDKKVDEKFEEIKSCNLCNDKGYRFTTCEKCNGEGHIHQSCSYCKGKGLTACVACGGKGVKITENAFKEKEYKTCTVCESKGVVTCPVCEGSKKEDIVCNQCKGKGKLVINKICNHSPLTSEDNSNSIFPQN